MSRALELLVQTSLAAGVMERHPITTFVAAAAGMLAGEPDRLEVRETVTGSARDVLLVELVPVDGDYGKIFGKGGEILEAVRMVAKRMAQRDRLTVEIKIRDPRARA